MSISLLVVLAILASIGLGYLTKINIGFYALSFAYIIGAFLMGLKPSAIIALWPMQLFFLFFAVTFFYSFAAADGTMEKISMKVVYKCRNYPYFLPFAIYFLGITLSGMGAGFYAVMALLGPMAIILARKSGMNPFLAVVAAALGGMVGSDFITSVGGIIIKGLIINGGFIEQAQSYTVDVFLNGGIYYTILLVILYFVFNGHKTKKVDVERPEPFTKTQKLNLAILGFVVVVMIVPPILNVVFPNPLFKMINSKVDIGFVTVIASILVILFKAGDEKKAFSTVPWGIIITICGVGTLIGVAVKAGTIQMLAAWIGSSVPLALVPVVTVLISGSMALISSGYGVVMPTLFPIVPHLAQITHMAPSILYSLITISILACGFSPFSAGGALIMASMPDDEMRKKYLPVLLFVLPPFNLLLALLLNYLGVFIH